MFSQAANVLIPDNKGEKPGMAVHDAYHENIRGWKQ